MRSLESVEREKFYDEEVAPVLRDLRDRCANQGLAFLSVVEWDVAEEGEEAEDWAVRGSTRGRPAVAPGKKGVSTFFQGMWELAKRGYLCQNITTITVVRESSRD